jgi:phosphonate utilization associated putative membrane protein
LDLTWPIVAAVLFGALLHAGWNALVKSSGDKTLDTALVHFMGALVALPFALWAGPPRPESWPFMGASLVIHVGYYIALAGAYRHGDLGLTYPIMRGFAPLLVALGSSAVIGEVPSPGAWLGIVGITCGVALVGLSRPGQALHQGKALAYAFANAAIIAAYTFTDGLGVRSEVAHGGATLRYVLVLFVLDGIAYPLGVWLHRGPAGRRTIVAYARSRWPLAALGGTASIGSYAIALWAMTRAPVASVAALRETSVLFAAVLGTCLLKEKFGLQRAIGTLVVVAGVMALRLG